MSKFFTFVYIAFILLELTAVASPIDEQLYGALKIEEVNVTEKGILGAASFEKRAGSLVCARTIGTYPSAVSSYHCALAGDKGLDGELYNALNIQEENVTTDGVMGSVQFRKQIGNFVCIKSQGVYPGAQATFSCGFKYEVPSQPTLKTDGATSSAN